MDTKLTKRQAEIAELIAWGASKKDVANRLFISERTVENHTRDIYEKTGCTKVNELSAWWFCTTFNISFDLSPFKRNVISMVLLAILVVQVPDLSHNNIALRTRSNISYRAGRARSRRKGEDDLIIC